MSTLTFDQRASLGGSPGIHALIVGISSYPHLPDGAATPTPNSFGMRQLSSAAMSAFKMYQWLLERQHRLVAPLASCRLMLSPSEKELHTEPQLEKFRVATTLENFLVSANEWRRDALTNPESVTIFYFAGNGFEMMKSEPVLVLEDFGNGVGPLLRSTVSVNNIFYGMAPISSGEGVARRQLYFIDTNRVAPGQLKYYEQLNTTAVFDAQQLGIDDRQAAIFYASAPGAKSYGIKGGQSLFSMALLRCLNGAAGKPGEEDEQGRQTWEVSVSSLTETLSYALEKVNEQFGASQSFAVSGLVRDWTIHHLDSPPKVDVVIEVEPGEARHLIRVEVLDTEGNLIWRSPVPLEPHPYVTELPAGFYKVNTEIINEDSTVESGLAKIRLVQPPRSVWRFRGTR